MLPIINCICPEQQKTFFEIFVAPNSYHSETEGTLMKIITLHALVIMVEGFYASASEIRRTRDTSPCDGTRN